MVNFKDGLNILLVYFKKDEECDFIYYLITLDCITFIKSDNDSQFTSISACFGTNLSKIQMSCSTHNKS